MNEDEGSTRDTAHDEWWLAHLGRLLVWSRLRVLESGVAEVFDCDGRINVYESDDIARAALMDAEFRALDGMDADDAAAWGLDLEEIEPPRDRVAQRGGVGHVGDDMAVVLVGAPGQGGYDSFEAVRATREHGDVGAGDRERFGGGAADAVGPAADQGMAAAKIGVHRVLPSGGITGRGR